MNFQGSGGEKQRVGLVRGFGHLRPEGRGQEIRFRGEAGGVSSFAFLLSVLPRSPERQVKSFIG